MAAALEFREVAYAAQQGGDVASLFGLLHGALEVLAHFGVGAPVLLDEVLGFLHGDFELASQSLRTHAVEDAEVDDLGAVALLVGYLVRLDMEDRRGSGAMDVEPLAECPLQLCIA